MQISIANEQAMKDCGFPTDLQNAFKRTAEETRCVVLSRVPGRAATPLIAAGHDLKGYFIKAKSCDWGPMSGFVCQVPAFTKKGVAGIEFNVNRNLEYHREFFDRLRPPQEGAVAAAPRESEAAAVRRQFTANKVAWQDAWGHLLSSSENDAIETTRRFLKGKLSENVVTELIRELQIPQEGLFTDHTGHLNEESDKEKLKRYLGFVVHDLRMLVGDDSPFVPLRLSQDVFDHFKKATEEDIATIGDFTCGIAHKSTPDPKRPSHVQTVWFKYIVKRNEEGFYEPYHGNIWIYDGVNRSPLDSCETVKKACGGDKNKSTLGIPGSESKDGLSVNELCREKTDEVVNAIEGIHKIFKASLFKEGNGFPPEPDGPSARRESFYPIRGVQNYYPPFSGKDAYRNAVTGDYDLFACWPMIPDDGLEDMVRQSELVATAEDPLLLRMSSKKFSLRSTVSRHVFIEVIPSGEEIGPLEHGSFGNPNGVVLNVAGTLNSFAISRADLEGSAKGVVRNVAFHSDECGRSDIDGVEYPVAAFVPAALMGIKSIATALLGHDPPNRDTQMFILKTHVDLLTLIDAVKSRCYVPLNFAWVYDFLMSYNADAQQLLKALFCTPDRDAEFNRLKQTFQELFGTSRGLSAREKISKLASLMPGGHAAP